jgi:hypothetical protein
MLTALAPAWQDQTVAANGPEDFFATYRHIVPQMRSELIALMTQDWAAAPEMTEGVLPFP